MARLHLEKLTKRFGRQTVVDQIDLQVADQELLVLVGPSGCGKTTTLRMIAGLESPDGGRIRVGPRYVERLPPKDRQIAMVFQDLALYPHRNVRGNLAFGRQMRGAPRQETRHRVEHVAELLGIQHLLPRKPDQLSGGQQQRVAIGRALVCDADVLLLDEPFSDLDARLRMRLRMELVRLQRDLGRTIVQVTHDQVEAMMIGQRIAVMDAGRIQQVGTPQEVYQRPKNRFVAEFLGSQSMNFIRGTLVREAERLQVATGRFHVRLPYAFRERAGPWIGRSVDLGIRPEDVCLEPVPAATGQRLPAVVELVQPMGSQAILNLDLEGIAIAVCSSIRDARPVGSRVDVGLPPDRLHLFDPSSGHRI